VPGRLPSLNALRAFEAAARHGSFVAAAEELEVTPAAISHQIKGLEEHLGLALFTRHRRAVSLTSAGHRLLPGLSDGFARITAAVAAVAPHGRGPLTVAAVPGFAGRWLAPRLEAFLAAHPDVAVRLEPKGGPIHPGQEAVDLAVCTAPVGDGAEPLFEDWVFPVCAPVLRVALTAPGNLSMQTLLVDRSAEAEGGGAWAAWLEKAGVPALKPKEWREFTHAAPALDAALRAEGVALARGSMVAAELRAGTLVRPFEMAVPAGAPYVLLRDGKRDLLGGAQAFRDWLKGEAEAFRAAYPKLVR